MSPSFSRSVPASSASSTIWYGPSLLTPTSFFHFNPPSLRLIHSFFKSCARPIFTTRQHADLHDPRLPPGPCGLGQRPRPSRSAQGPAQPVAPAGHPRGGQQLRPGRQDHRRTRRHLQGRQHPGGDVDGRQRRRRRAHGRLLRPHRRGHRLLRQGPDGQEHRRPERRRPQQLPPRQPRHQLQGPGHQVQQVCPAGPPGSQRQGRLRLLRRRQHCVISFVQHGCWQTPPSLVSQGDPAVQTGLAVILAQANQLIYLISTEERKAIC